jgi:hypothetical protein
VKASLRFVIQQQIMSNWCWAAVATSVFKYYRPASLITQRKFVSDILQIPQCNTTGQLPLACNKPYGLVAALDSLRIYDGWENKPTHPDIIYDELINKRPVGILLSNNVNNGHFLVISGINLTPSGTVLTIEDPINASTRDVRYSLLVNGFEGSYWTKTYFTRRF